MRRAAKWTAGGIAGGIVALVIAAAAAVALFDWNRLRGPLAERLSEQSGREVAIRGDLQGEVSPTPRVVIRGARSAPQV